MRVAFIHDSIFLTDDKEIYSLNLTDEVWKRYESEIDSLIVIGRGKRADLNEIQQRGFKKIRKEFISHNLIFEYNNILNFIKRFQIINRKISSSVKSVDAVILRIPSVLGSLAYYHAKKNKKPILVECVGCSLDSYLYFGDIKSKLLAVPMFLLQRHVVKNANITNYITRGFLQKRYPTNGLAFSGVTNITIHRDKLSPNPLENQEKTIQLNSMVKTDRKILIGMVGSLNVKYKGHLTALKTIKRLKELDDRFELQLVGPCNNFEPWQTLIDKLDINKNVKYVGTLSSGEEINKWYRDLDIYIQPSLSEGHGRSLVEAVLNTCISFATNTGGIPDTLSKEYLFSKKDDLALSKFIFQASCDIEYSSKNISRNFLNLSEFEENKVESKRRDSLKILNLLSEENDEEK